MKTLLLVFLFYNIKKIVIADDETLQTASILSRSFPKKFDSVVHKHLNILNRRYLKVSVLPTENTKKDYYNSAYTAFPPVDDREKKYLGSPDSPYFPLDNNDEQRPRVKKVLPEYYSKSVIRRKRAAKASKKDEKKNLQKKEDKHVDSKIKAVKNDVPKLKSGKEVKNSDKKIEKKDKKKESDEVDKDSDKEIDKDIDKKIDKENEKKAKSKHLQRSPAKLRAKHKSHKPPKQVRDGIKVKSNKAARKLPKGAVVRDKSNKRKNDKKKSRRKRFIPHDGRRSKVKESRRLIASRDAAIENYPYVISILKDGEHWCAGALLNQRLAITTANCMWKATRETRMKIRAGSRYTDRGGQVVKIQEVVKHPSWSIRGGPDNDLALLLLDKNVRFSHDCHGVDLPNRIMYPVFEDAWITSWGAERRDGIYERPLTLQVYHARLIERAKCNNVTTRFGVSVSDNFICLTQTGRRAPCTRDTGAPAVSDGVLWGLASWGIRKLCGTERFPAMFSYTASQSNMDFITTATTYLMSEERNVPFHDRYPFQSLANYSKLIITTPAVKINDYNEAGYEDIVHIDE